MGKLRTLEFYPRLVRAVGPVHAIVLSKIFYWCDGRLRVKRKGKLWLAKSRREMCEETGFSLGQQKRAVAALKQQGLIVVERGLFQNKITPFIRLTKQGLELFESVKSSHSTGPEASQSSVAEPGQPNGTEPCQSSTVLHGTKDTTASTALGDFVAKGHTNKLGNQSQEKKGIKVKNNGPSPHCAAPPSMDSKQTLDKLQSKKESPPTVPKTATGLAVAWHKLVPYYHDLPALPGGLKVKPLTQKEVGMLSLYLKAVGPADAYPVMHWAIQHWPLLAISVKEAKGGTLPTQPGVPLLLKYYDVAVGCYKNSHLTIAKNHTLALLSDAEKKAKLLAGK